MNTKLFRIPVFIIILTIGIILGIQIEKVFSGDNFQDSIDKFSQVMRYTERFYLEDVDTQKLVESAINGMLDELDPHSVYIPAEQLTSVEESFRGDFEGIGIEFQIVNDTLTVVSPITGGPSEALGIMSGDRIIKIDGKSAIGITNEQVRNKLRGEAGTEVKVTIVRPGDDEQIEYTIERDKIPLFSVDAKLMVDDKIGYVSVSRFSETTFSEVKDALDDLKQKGMEQLILDLRGNPGGYLNQAVKIADLFIEDEKKIVYTEGRRSEFNEDYLASEKYEYEDVPLIVLVNRGSASASEIVAGAVQDWDRGLIVGETSFGKGLVQRQFELEDNSAIRLTISEYYTPSGRLIQREYKDKKDREEYYSELNEIEETEGENIEHTSEQDSLKPEFKTDGGRIVYGGGGITPDYIVKQGSSTDFTRNLLRKNVFYQFVRSYLDSNTDEISKKYGEDLDKFISEFNFSDSDMIKFLEVAENKEIEIDTEDLEEDKNYILTRLKAQVARNFWKNEGWYSVMIANDDQFQKAITLFDEAKDLADLN